MEYNYTTSQAPDKGVQVGPEPTPTLNAALAAIQASIPGFGGNLIEVDIVTSENKRAVYTSKAYPANANGKQRPGAIVEYNSEFSVGEGIGGYTSVLPNGYLRAAFLESTGAQYIDTGYKPNANFGVYFDVQEVTTPSSKVWYCGAQVSGNSLWLDSQERFAIRNGAGGYGAFWLEETKSEKNRVQAVANFYNDRLYGKVGEAKTYNAVPTQDLTFTLFRSHYRQTGNFDPTAPLRMFAFKLTTGAELKIDFVPCIDASGVPCMYNKVDKTASYNKNTSSVPFIVGLTLAQARKLGKLPSGGGSLKVSLPSNYGEDEGVVNAIAEANAKNWNIEVASTWDASGTSATFALRRIWVRKTQDENGSYIDSDGTRWAVESCIAMYNADGSEPEAHGYEPYRSVEAAVEYWGLIPWIDPEQEEEFSQDINYN